jgi:hypothetical protein
MRDGVLAEGRPKVSVLYGQGSAKCSMIDLWVLLGRKLRLGFMVYLT